MKRLLTDFLDKPGTELRGFVGASANRGRKPVEEPALSAEAARSDESAKHATSRRSARGSRAKFRRTSRCSFPVNAVLSGRRNNPADHKAGIPPLAVYNPIHYQELPELFMDLICSLTGKSPATTGFGSEGALTKGPFNALPGVIDVNNALVSAILTENSGFTTAAGFIGPKYRVDHDNSMLVPELWCRMRVAEREPRFLIENGYLEKVDDFEFERNDGAGQPAGISHHRVFCRPLPGADLRNAGDACFRKRCCVRKSRTWRNSPRA